MGSWPSPPAHSPMYKSSSNETRNILGLKIRAVEQAKAVALIDDRVKAGLLTRVAFANSNLLNHAATNCKLHSSLNRFLLFNDGIATDMAAFVLYGRPFPANLNGTDFIPHYLRNTPHCYRIFLVGGLPNVAERAAGLLSAQYDGKHEVVGFANGFDDLRHPDRLLREITDSKADVLLVALGNPKQEIWLDRHFELSGCKLAFCVGALLDFTAGRMKRAPVALRNMRLEWAFRLAQEPRRLTKRYMVDTPVFMLRTIRQRLLRYPSNVSP